MYCGLSPRVRGNQRHYANGYGNARSIPACAGEPPGLAELRLIEKVYPRVCGGTPTYGVLDLTKQGLSPRVRGNLGVEYQRNAGIGSIPACAGEP